MTYPARFCLVLLLYAGFSELPAYGGDNGQIAISLATALGPAQSGRAIIFGQALRPHAKLDKEVDFDLGSPEPEWIEAEEVNELRTHETTTIEASAVYPGPLSALPPGDYEIQAVLDRNHSYAYAGRGPGDLLSRALKVKLPGKIPVLVLDHEIVRKSTPLVASAQPWQREAVATWAATLKPIEFQSPLMTQFYGTPTFLRGWVALPPGYEARRSFATVFSFSGFGGDLRSAQIRASSMEALMAAGTAPPMIWVYLDYVIASGTHQFVDSANNGPWGEALTTELLPFLEQQYKMKRRASARFLTGHSTGGWTALWLQVRYPSLFGGAWPTSPDPSDFHDFFQVDLYRADANLYQTSDGRPNPLSRSDDDGPVVTMAADAQSEVVLGEYGGQFATYEWMYSPRGANGRPAPLFDRVTGKIDPAVAAYWCEHYDIAHLITQDWARLKADLDGKIHVLVGTADTFYLDGPAHQLEAAMRSVGAKTDFRYLPGKTHGNLYIEDDDHYALTKRIAAEMSATARAAGRRRYERTQTRPSAP
jgi:S-formylglutathione hydrolase FrmB